MQTRVSNFGREEAIGTAHYLPLTQTSGGGPTRASICEDGAYYSGKLFVRDDGVVMFIADGEKKIMDSS